MSNFKREERYIVVKIKDLKYSSVENKLRRTLYEAGIPTRECLVVESDWPEYEPVWAMIEARMTGQPDELTRLRAENANAVEALEDVKQRLATTQLNHERENEALRADAERYRWLRTTDRHDVFVCFDDFSLDGKELDAAIDAARKER